MTVETYKKAGEIIAKIEAKARHRKNVQEWINNKSGASLYGIRGASGELVNTIIRPDVSEINTMLILMRERLNREIRELEKQLEELQ